MILKELGLIPKGEVVMKLTISGKQMELTQGIKENIESKLSRLDKYVRPDTDVIVTVSAK